VKKKVRQDRAGRSAARSLKGEGRAFRGENLFSRVKGNFLIRIVHPGGGSRDLGSVDADLQEARAAAFAASCAFTAPGDEIHVIDEQGQIVTRFGAAIFSDESPVSLEKRARGQSTLEPFDLA